MTHTWLTNEHLTVEIGATGKPVTLRWRGRLHRVQQIVQSWEISTDWWESDGEIERTYHALITHAGLLCVVYRDDASGNWFLAKTYD